MPFTLQNFGADLEAFRTKLGISKASLFQKLALDLFNGIVRRTPVDTGRARASWNLTTGTPSGGNPAPGSYGPPDAPLVAGIDGTAEVWVTSNLEYIEPLEHGHSKQAPAGMVRVTVAEIAARIHLTLAKL